MLSVQREQSEERVLQEPVEERILRLEMQRLHYWQQQRYVKMWCTTRIAAATTRYRNGPLVGSTSTKDSRLFGRTHGLQRLAKNKIRTTTWSAVGCFYAAVGLYHGGTDRRPLHGRTASKGSALVDSCPSFLAPLDTGPSRCRGSNKVRRTLFIVVVVHQRQPESFDSQGERSRNGSASQG